jgi:hypothetical protein
MKRLLATLFALAALAVIANKLDFARRLAKVTGPATPAGITSQTATSTPQPATFQVTGRITATIE